MLRGGWGMAIPQLRWRRLWVPRAPPLQVSSSRHSPHRHLAVFIGLRALALSGKADGEGSKRPASMYYLSFDCHKEQHSWTLLKADGHVVDRGEVINEASALRQLRAALPPELRIGLEGPRDLRREVERQFAGLACFEISPAWTHALRQRSPWPDKDDARDADRAAQALWAYGEQLVPLPLEDERWQALRAVGAAQRASPVRRGPCPDVAGWRLV
jgi:hypothetical protein